MGRSSVRPVVRGFIAEQHVRSMFTGTSQICSGTRSEEDATYLFNHARHAPAGSGCGPAFCSADGGSLAASADDPLYAPF